MPYRKVIGKYEKYCEICKRAFRTNRLDRVTCGRIDCQNKHRSLKMKREGKSKDYSRVCIICDKHFITTNPQHNCCSDECREKKWKKKYDEVYSTHEYRMNHGGKNSWYKLRFLVLQRDDFRCQYCGKTPKDGIRLQVDHIIPRSEKGTNEMNNLITSCEICNLGKYDVLLEQHEIEKIKKKNGLID